MPPYEMTSYQTAPYEAAPYDASGQPPEPQYEQRPPEDQYYGAQYGAQPGAPPYDPAAYESQPYGTQAYGPPYDTGGVAHEQPGVPAGYEDATYQMPPYAQQEQPPLLPFDGPAYASPPAPPTGPQAPQGPQGYGPPQAYPYYPQQAPYAQPPVPQTADSLSPETLLRGRKRPPSHGWRRAVYKASGGVLQPGESPAELRRRELVHRIRTPVAGGHHRVAVMSLKGGVGKTTSTVGLGATLASLRGDRVIAVDANPDRGTLSDKVRLETATTVRDLLNERMQIQRYADVRAFTSQAPSRLEVLASDHDPAVSEAFSEEDYRAVARVLEHYYSICITDCGTGLLHSAMAGVLGLAEQIVLVSSPSVDGARSASATLDWLEAHDYRELVWNAVVVLSTVRPKSKSTVDIDRLQQHFATRCRAVVRVPYDPHLEEGAEVDLERLRPETRDAYLQLAATVGDGFAQARAVRSAW
ncbi:MAG: AAA family ATPase [Streptosporangiales bacterium]|nr:AAA family ATPase [Streptosporangiales bacterium]